jgi:prepilin-type N-terminal cleavage/methylation domain-containing protein
MDGMRARFGFTLVEMAIVLVVLGIIMTLLLPPLVATVKRDKTKESRRDLRAAKDSVIGYAMITGYLPDTLGDVGVETDAWGQDLEYVQDIALVQGTGLGICDAEPDDTIQYDNTITAGGSVDDVALIIASPGEDRQLEVDLTLTAADLTDPGDDLVEYVTLNQLKTLVRCGYE